MRHKHHRCDHPANTPAHPGAPPGSCASRHRRIQYNKQQVITHLYRQQSHCSLRCGRSLDNIMRAGESLAIEHSVPFSKGGYDGPSNFTLSCQRCNSQKGAQPVKEFCGPGGCGVSYR